MLLLSTPLHRSYLYTSRSVYHIVFIYFDYFILVDASDRISTWGMDAPRAGAKKGKEGVSGVYAPYSRKEKCCVFPANCLCDLTPLWGEINRRTEAIDEAIRKTVPKACIHHCPETACTLTEGKQLKYLFVADANEEEKAKLLPTLG